MSIFDPHELYVHHQKSTRKGQIIQKKPVRHTGVLTEDQIPQAIQVLNAYGYTIYRPGFRLPKSFSVPFLLTASELTFTTFFFSVNTVWSSLKTSFASLRTFISQNPYVNNSTVGIGFSSIFVQGKIGNFQYKFYENNTININQSITLGADPTYPFSMTFGPSNTTHFVFSFDNGLGSIASSGQTSILSRSASTDVPSQICYAIIENKWSELKTPSGLTTDIKLLEGSSLSEGSQVNSYIVNGFLSVNLNK